MMEELGQVRLEETLQLEVLVVVEEVEVDITMEVLI